VASGADYTDSSVKLWQASDGTHLKTFTGHAEGVQSVDLSPDGQHMAVGYVVTGYPPGGVMNLWDILQETVLYEFGGCFVAFSPDGEMIASGGCGVNRYVYLHRVSDGERIYDFYTGTYILSIAYSPDGQIVASGGSDNNIQLWDLNQGVLLRTLIGHTDDVSTIAFSPDGQFLASGAGGFDNPGESSIKLWRVSDGELLRTYEGHDQWVYAVAFSPNGQVLISGGRDGTYPYVDFKIKFWRTSTGELLQYYDETALDVVYSPDGQRFFYGRSDGMVVMAHNPPSIPDIFIDVFPDDPPVQVPRGGSFTFSGALSNNTNEVQTTDVWIMVDIPGYGLYGPIRQYDDIVLDPHEVINVPGVREHIPQKAPLGMYEYIAYYGEYPSSPIAFSSFEFTVVN
jgi:WD40 repeat protein